MSDVHDQLARVREDSDIPAPGKDEQPMETDLHKDRTREFSHTSFSRMRTGWSGDDAEKILDLETLAREIVRERFAIAFAIVRKIEKMTRKQAYDEATGEFLTYPDGSPVWAKDELGIPVENWELLSDDDRSHLLHTIAIHMFEWEIEAAVIKSDALYAKGIWEEVFATGFIAIPSEMISGRPTVQDKEQWGTKNAAKERYFGLFRSSISYQADGILSAIRGLQRVLESTQVR